ncbi:hypothetical protein DFJ74DRAFT_697647 [Hyaloraphidium curvatum]|nr:hypothetical protein DFJ74DRAFT_697647 [Hyaloraphidium curvatum]
MVDQKRVGRQRERQRVGQDVALPGLERVVQVPGKGGDGFLRSLVQGNRFVRLIRVGELELLGIVQHVEQERDRQRRRRREETEQMLMKVDDFSSPADVPVTVRQSENDDHRVLIRKVAGSVHCPNLGSSSFVVERRRLDAKSHTVLYVSRREAVLGHVRQNGLDPDRGLRLRTKFLVFPELSVEYALKVRAVEEPLVRNTLERVPGFRNLRRRPRL